jgi:O-antigen biosynthesis protein
LRWPPASTRRSPWCSAAPGAEVNTAVDDGGVTAPIIRVYPADLGGCGFYRCIWPGEALATQGATVEVIRPDAPDSEQIQATWWEGDSGRELVDVAPVEADIVVIQRPLTDTLCEAIPKLQAQGVRVVVEIDDDFDAISPRNVSWSKVQPATSPRRNREWLRKACQQADLVVVSTPALARRYGAHGRVRVVRNRVPARYLALPRPEPRPDVWVGWTGAIQTHPDDLQVTGGGVARALRAAGGRLAVIGTGKGVAKALGIRGEVYASGWVPIDDYPVAVAQLDVGIVPLELSPFNEAKSALKLMEMASTGVVPVVSPTAENLTMAAQVGALVADSPRQWEGIVKRLVADEGWRAGQSERVRSAMAAHTIEGNAGEWWDAWSSVVNTPCAA